MFDEHDDKAFLSNPFEWPSASDAPGFKYACVKKRNPDGGWPLAYGIVLEPDFRAGNFIVNVRDDVKGVDEKAPVFEKFSSIDELLKAGWVVD